MSDISYNEIMNKEHQKCENGTCPAIGYQSVSVCLPVEIEPFAQAGAAKVSCFGEPIIKSGCKSCKGKRKGTCSFTISQTICVEVPVVFGATANVGETFVDCDDSKHWDDDCSHMELSDIEE